MITIKQLEQIIADTTSGTDVHLDGEAIGSIEYVRARINELKIARSDDRDFIDFCFKRQQWQNVFYPILHAMKRKGLS